MPCAIVLSIRTPRTGCVNGCQRLNHGSSRASFFAAKWGTRATTSHPSRMTTRKKFMTRSVSKADLAALSAPLLAESALSPPLSDRNCVALARKFWASRRSRSRGSSPLFAAASRHGLSAPSPSLVPDPPSDELRDADDGDFGGSGDLDMHVEGTARPAAANSDQPRGEHGINARMLSVTVEGGCSPNYFPSVELIVDCLKNSHFDDSNQNVEWRMLAKCPVLTTHFGGCPKQGCDFEIEIDADEI
jgi:hypothetical protein